MNILPGVKEHPILAGATVFAAFLISYLLTESLDMPVVYRAVAIGGVCMVAYIVTDMVIRAGE